MSGAKLRRLHCSPKAQGGRGWKQVGYSDLIHLDGTVENLVKYHDDDDVIRPEEVTNGAAGYNATSRHVCYVGGVAADGKTPKDTRTPAQRRALREYVAQFRKRHPRCQVIGHRDLPNVHKACPSFDVTTQL